MKTTQKRLKPIEKAEIIATEYKQIADRKEEISKAIKASYGEELEKLAERQKVIEAELNAFALSNEKCFNNKRHCRLGPVVIKIGTAGKLIYTPKFNALAFATAFPLLVKIEPQLGVIAKALQDADNRKAVTKMGVDVKVEDKIKIEFSK